VLNFAGKCFLKIYLLKAQMVILGSVFTG